MELMEALVQQKKRLILILVKQIRNLYEFKLYR